MTGRRSPMLYAFLAVPVVYLFAFVAFPVTYNIVMSLQGAQIVSATTTNIRPDQGHVHLYVDNQLYSMKYGLEQDIPAAVIRASNNLGVVFESSDRYADSVSITDRAEAM